MTRTLLPLLLALCAANASANMKLYVFDCGSITFEDVSMFSVTNAETPVRKLFVPCYLIEHPEGRMLWDGGLPLEMVGQGDVIPQPGVVMRYDRSLIDQLADLDLMPADVDIVAFSHMHYDHVGAANEFEDSKLLIQADEFEAAFVTKDNPVFRPELYLELADSERQILNGDHDVFGDGSVVIVSAPGHTPGHQVLLLKLEDLGPLVLSGDLYHFRLSRQLRRTPAFNSDATDTLASMDKVEALVKAEGATFWIEHDQALADTLELAPAYYE